MNDIPVVIPELPSLTPEKRVWGGWATAGFGAVILIAFFIVQSVIAVVGIFAFGMPDFSQFSPGMGFNDVLNSMTEMFDNLGLIQSIATIVSGVAGMALIMAFIKVRERAGIAEYLGLSKISLKGVLLSVAVVIGFLAASIGMSYLMKTSDTEQIMYDLYETSVWPALFWIAVVIFAPAFEEVLFRGFLFEGFRQSRIGVVGAIGVTSLFWACLHILQYSLLNVGWILFMGIVMGIVRLKTKSLWNTIIIHALVNVVAMLEITLNIDKLFS